MTDWKLIEGDASEELSKLDSSSIQTCVTSPPYFNLRDYGIDGQIGTEDTVDEYVARLVNVFREVRRVLTDDGTVWLNLGDTYRNRSLIGIPWRVALALQADGWWLRSDVIWHKLNAMPESVKDRPTRSHEHIFLLAKSLNYYYDNEAIKEPVKALRAEGKNAFRGQNAIRAKGKARDGWKQSKTRNKRDVWSVATQPFKDAHFAVFPERLIEPCVLAGSRPGEIVLDPFAGAGTTGLVAIRHGRDFIGIDLNRDYVELAKKRITRRIQGGPS